MNTQDESMSSTADYFLFRAMIAVPLLTVAFYLSLLLIGGACVFFWHWRAEIDGPALAFIEADFIFLFCGILSRLVCEVLIVVFKIHEALERLNSQSNTRATRLTDSRGEAPIRHTERPRDEVKIYT